MTYRSFYFLEWRTASQSILITRTRSRKNSTSNRNRDSIPEVNGKNWYETTDTLDISVAMGIGIPLFHLLIFPYVEIYENLF